MFLLQFHHVVFDIVNLREYELDFARKLTIEVFACEACSGVTTNDSIGVEHRNDLEDNTKISEKILFL
jgi:hypothetical protein